MNNIMNDDVVIERGFQSLIDALGVVNAERFIAIMNRKKQNYDEWREEYFDKMTTEEYKKELFDFAKAQKRT